MVSDEQRLWHCLDRYVLYIAPQQGFIRDRIQMLHFFFYQLHWRDPCRPIGLLIYLLVEFLDPFDQRSFTAQLMIVWQQPLHEPVRRLHLSLGLWCPYLAQMDLYTDIILELLDDRQLALAAIGDRHDSAHVICDQLPRLPTGSLHHFDQAPQKVFGRLGL